MNILVSAAAAVAGRYCSLVLSSLALNSYCDSICLHAAQWHNGSAHQYIAIESVCDVGLIPDRHSATVLWIDTKFVDKRALSAFELK